MCHFSVPFCLSYDVQFLYDNLSGTAARTLKVHEALYSYERLQLDRPVHQGLLDKYLGL